jgi:mRNA-degrading endonuclease RelE of RelBE toxin-antitoxin system
VPNYHVIIKPSAAKELDKLPVSVAARIAAKIDSLAQIPPAKRHQEIGGRAKAVEDSCERLAGHLRDR